MKNKTALHAIQDWVQSYPGFTQLHEFAIDYTEQIPGSGGLMPDGLVEIGRHIDIVGNTTVINQYNFMLYLVFAKAPGDEIGAEENAQWLMDFQNWVQEQSIMGRAPTFGDDKAKETIKAQNGTLYGADKDGTALYTVNLSVQFIKKYEEENPWLK